LRCRGVISFLPRPWPGQRGRRKRSRR
jgi:hypothetical protein